MNQIVSYILLMLFMTISLAISALVTRFSKIRNSSKFVKAKKLKQKKIESLILALVAIYMACYTAYCSVDLIKQDYVTADLEFISRYSRRHSLGYLAYSFKGETLNFYSGRGPRYVLQEGVTYRVTYAPRTSMIINIEGEELSGGLDSIYESGDFKTICIVTLLIIIIVVLRLWWVKRLGYKPEQKWKKR